MSRRGRPGDLLGAAIAAVLRVGTLASVAAIAVGYAMALVAGTDSGPEPVLAQLRGGGAPAVVAAGLLALTFIPLGALLGGAFAFARGGERDRLAVTLLVVALLAGSLVAAAVVAPSS